MKTGLILIAIAMVLLTQTGLYAGITGSAHDFSGKTHSDGEICKVCHVPHSAGSNLVPLWRGNLSSSTTYQLYSSDTLDATLNQPLVPTKACLTCHDGSIAKGPVTGCTSCHSLHGANTDLSNDHPVSFLYDTTLVNSDESLQDPASTQVISLGNKTIQAGMLYENRLECTSCHDVHATKGDSETAGRLLLVNNNNSSLCLTCHKK